MKYALALVASLATLGAFDGCLARQVHAVRDVGIDIVKGPPCIVTLTADGDIVSVTDGPECVMPQLVCPSADAGSTDNKAGYCLDTGIALNTLVHFSCSRFVHPGSAWKCSSRSPMICSLIASVHALS